MSERQWVLATARSSHVVSLLPDGRGLLFDQWGPTTSRPRPPAALPASVPFSTPLDVAPLEYATTGTRHVQQVELVVDHGDGRRGASWRLDDAGVAFNSADGVTTLAVRFIDDSGGLALTLNLRTDIRHDVVEKWARVENLTSDRTVTLPRVFSGAWPIPVTRPVRVEYLAGAWAREFQPQQVDLPAGVLSFGSRQGITGHSFAPTVCVSSRSGPDAYGVALGWCGSWRLAVEVPPFGDHVRVSCGVDDDDTVVTLLPGESFTTPPTRFGLWVEPEGVNPDSDLYRAHPEWVYQAEGRPLTTIRNQLVLDFGRDEVVSWVEETLRGLLARYPISYLKWDMNRPVSDGGRVGDMHGRQWSIQHAAGYLRVMRMLREEFPHVTIEACAGGGGRIDHSVLSVSDVVWTSDETGPRDRLHIQDGFLRAYAPHVMSSWITDELGHSDRMPVSLGYRFVVAMAGVLGVGADLLRWTDDERVAARRLIKLYKELRPVVHRGELFVRGEPHRPGYALEYSLDTRTVLLVYDANRDRREPVRIRPCSLAPDGIYEVLTADGPAGLRRTGLMFTGATACSAGIEVPWSVAPDADVLVLDRISKESHRDRSGSSTRPPD